MSDVGIAIWFLGTCILASAFLIVRAVQVAVQTTKLVNVNWNPTVNLVNQPRSEVKGRDPAASAS